MSSPQLTPDQAKFILGMALPTLKNEHQTTRQVIEAIPLDKGDYRPDAVSKTALELAWHIAAAEKRFLNGIVDGGFDFSPISRPETVRNSADIGRWYGEMFDQVFARLQKMTPEQLSKVLDFRRIFPMPAA